MIGKGNDCLFPLYLPMKRTKKRLRVRCGHCINCKIHRAQEWCIRLEDESHYWREICFVTLTYNDDSLPKHVIDGHLFYEDEEIEQHPELGYIYEPTLRSDHLCLFIKRLRKQIVSKIRYYAVGEYGTRVGRPHFHLIVFGLPYVFQKTEDFLSKIWPYGFVVVRPFYPETCSYIAGYVQKKLYGKDRYLFKLPEFMRCSQHLGEQWLLDNISSFDNEHPYIVKNGFKYGIPRQWRKILVKKGRLKETSDYVAAKIQEEEYMELCKDLELKGISIQDFFSQRIKNAVYKERRKLNSRNKTGDI